ncbi:MAG: tRNA (adenosine(37)-N6)-threonylcarbamoyltransferase complex dimerization subunit type 1 TsaB [Ferruginibacter sp.]
MSLLLNIDTALTTAYVSIAKDGVVLQDAINNDQKEHAAFVQPAIKRIMQKAGILLAEIDAVAVTIGPGSYTGLRVGLSSAKGLCYALNKPLIVINTLECMTMAAILQLQETSLIEAKLFCPMIDARRMEVYTAIYDYSLNSLLTPCALLLEPTVYDKYLDKNSIVFFGDGSIKWKNNCTNYNADFQSVNINSTAMSLLSFKKYISQDNCFTDTAYTEPLYIKAFYSGE